MNKKKRIVIIGGTSAIAEHCAQIWIRNQVVHLTLVGRDKGRIERVAQDLKVRNPIAEIECIQMDFSDPQAIQATVQKFFHEGTVDIALIAQGSLPDQVNCQNDINYCKDELFINGISPVLFAEAFAKGMEKVGRGSIALIGSVAGDRGRQSNYVYGAAKGLITRYAEGLQHRFANSKIKITLTKPGPTDTPMTAHLKELGKKLTPVEQVALHIVQAVNKGKEKSYAPNKWFFIMMIIRHLPKFIFNKLKI